MLTPLLFFALLGIIIVVFSILIDLAFKKSFAARKRFLVGILRKKASKLTPDKYALTYFAPKIDKSDSPEDGIVKSISKDNLGLVQEEFIKIFIKNLKSKN